MSSMGRMTTVIASTKRNPSISGGKRGVAVTNVVELRCTPLDPLDPEIQQRLALQSPHELLQTFFEGDYDVKEGDFLVVSDVEYPIRRCSEWDWRGKPCVHLVIENLKR